MPAASWDTLHRFFSEPPPEQAERLVFLREPDRTQRTTLVVDADIARRVAATVRAEALHEVDRRLRGKKLSPDARAQFERAWSDFAQALRFLVAENDPRPAATTVLVARADYRCLLRTRSPEATLALVRAVNVELLSLARTFSEIAGGLTTSDHAMPPRTELLPLSCFCGTTLAECYVQWLARGTAGYSAQRKALSVVRTMSTVLQGQPVEHMTPEHVRAYYARLRGLHPNTAYGYLTTLTSLVKRHAPSQTLRAIRELWPSQMQRAKLRIGRAALELDQLGTFLAAVFNDRALKTEDRVIVALLALTGARLEEICMLRAESLRWNGEYWTVSIELTSDEKRRLERIAAEHGLLGNPKYKNLPTLRTVPVYADAVEGLHEQLLKLSSRPGYAFEQLSTAAATGRRAGAFGQRVNRRMRELFGPDESVVLESVRTTVVTLLSETSISEDFVRAFVGHAPRDIHAEHYVKATPQKLVPVAREVRSFVLRALQGKDYMRLDIHYERWRRVLKRKGDVVQENIDTVGVQQPSLDVDQRQTVPGAEFGLGGAAPEIAALPLAAPPVVRRNAPNLGQRPSDEEVRPHRPAAATPCHRDGVGGLGLERNTVALEDTGNHELAKASNGSALRRKPRRSPGRASPHFFEQASRARSGRDRSLGAGPGLEEIELAASGKEVFDVLLMPRKLPLCSSELKHPSGRCPKVC